MYVADNIPQEGMRSRECLSSSRRFTRPSCAHEMYIVAHVYHEESLWNRLWISTKSKHLDCCNSMGNIAL
jgi:hypothetical protein